MALDPIEIKLKECCLTCDHFFLDNGKLGFMGCATSGERGIACIHIPVCGIYNGINAPTVVQCRECREWKQEGTYGYDGDGTKRQFGTCRITNLACKENHFCSYGRKSGWRNDNNEQTDGRA